jgi:hypothetical protein
MGGAWQSAELPFLFPAKQRIFVAPPRNTSANLGEVWTHEKCGHMEKPRTGGRRGASPVPGGDPVTAGKHRHRRLSSWNAVTIKVREGARTFIGDQRIGRASWPFARQIL